MNQSINKKINGYKYVMHIHASHASYISHVSHANDLGVLEQALKDWAYLNGPSIPE